MSKITIIIDSREQLPLDFVDETIEGIETMPLPVGDYGARFKMGYECPLIFERKSLPDLFMTLTQNYERFRKELEKAKKENIQLIIVIEGSLTDIYNGVPHSKREGSSIIKQLSTIWVKYSVPFYCFSSGSLNARYEMSRFIIETYNAIGRQAISNLKTKKDISNGKLQDLLGTGDLHIIGNQV